MINLRTIIILIIFLSYGSISFGQKLTFSPELGAWSGDKSVPKIAEVWKTYVNSFKLKNPDSVRTDLWLNGSRDMLKYVNSALLYRLGEQHTFNIRKLNDDVYEINTIARYDFDENGDATTDYITHTIYKVCAVERDGEFKLMNYFDFIKKSLNKYSVDCIEYYYPSSVDMSKKDARKAGIFIRDFKKLYNITDNNTITYIVANNLDEGSSILGMPFTNYRSEKTYAGRVIYPRILLSARPDHIHELVHGVMIPLYRDAPSFLHEGIATYYGGLAQKSYPYHAEAIREYLSNNSVDFSNLNWQYHSPIGDSYLPNTIGALMIDYALKNYDAIKVLDLFEAKSYEDIFLELGVQKDGINDFILKELVK